MSDSNFCNVPLAVAGDRGAGLCQWPMGHNLTWCVIETIPGFTIEELAAVCADAWKSWDGVCGITITRVTNPATANILIGTRRIDGPMGVLAEAELPCGNIRPNSQLRVWIDNSDRFVRAANPPAGKIDLLRVIRHEFGHSLGIGHNANGVTDSLMDPTVSHIVELQSWDIEQAVLRYGKNDIGGGSGGSGGTDTDGLIVLLDQLKDCLKKMTPETKKMISELLK